MMSFQNTNLMKLPLKKLTKYSNFVQFLSLFFPYLLEKEMSNLCVTYTLSIEYPTTT